MFVEASDFDNYPYALPNLQKRINTFTSFASEAEKEALIKLLGRSFYDLLIDGLAQANPDQMWLDIRDGADYIYSGAEYRFDGLKKLLVPYVYSQFIREDFERYSGIGTVNAKATNSEVVSPRRQICKGWNDFVELAGFTNEPDNYFYWHDHDSYNSSLDGYYYSYKNTLYGLLESNANYPEYEFRFPGTINVFDL